MPRMIVGLGNPGHEYESTRHNVGFEVVEALARELDLLFEHPRGLEGYTGPRDASVAVGDGVLLVRPLTFMNLSGTVVAPLARWAGIEPEQLLVVYDDLDLPPGRLRIRPHGGTGGHNGMKSIVNCLDTDQFPRLRVGIGRAGTDAARHVLGRLTRKEREEMDVAIAEAVEALAFWLESGENGPSRDNDPSRGSDPSRAIDECMTRFHSRWNQAPS